MEVTQTLVIIVLTAVIFIGVVMMLVGLWRKRERLNAIGTLVIALYLARLLGLIKPFPSS